MKGKRPLKTTFTSRVCAIVSRITVAVPVPADGVAGFSLSPLKDPLKVMVVAGLTEANNNMAATIAKERFIGSSLFDPDTSATSALL
jgi:hypothetical protein